MLVKVVKALVKELCLHLYSSCSCAMCSLKLTAQQVARLIVVLLALAWLKTVPAGQGNGSAVKAVLVRLQVGCAAE